MSMNILFKASREIQVVRTGAYDIQVTTFEVWQTPTDATKRIAGAAHPAAEYMAWVMEQSDALYEQRMFADDDVWLEHPIGHEIVDPRKDHLDEFNAWLDEMSVGGWVVAAVVV
jgi:hypothetical protein